MALLVDGNVSTINDLQGVDSAILEIARVENIDVTAKLLLAEQEIGQEIEAFLLRTGDVRCSRMFQLGQVAVTGGVRRWHTLRALSQVYGDAFHSQLNDRYGGKWREFLRQTREARELLFFTGVGIVLDPVRRAMAPNVSVTGGSLAAANYVVQVAWRNAAGAAGAASEEVVVPTQAGELLVVEAVEPPSNAVSFDVYVGMADGDPALQTSLPIPAGQSWAMPDSGLTAGVGPGDGQAPNIFVRLNRVMQRG